MTHGRGTSALTWRGCVKGLVIVCLALVAISLAAQADPRKTPEITWNDPADIVYGMALDGTQLNAVATDPDTGNPVAGNFVYTPDAGTVLDAGDGQTLYVLFTPDDLAYYDTATATANIAVTPRPITVTADAQSKVYGAADPLLTYRITSGSLVGSDSLSGGLIRAAGEDVGIYWIDQGTLTAGSNYDLSYVDANLQITKANATILVTPYSVTYDGNDHTASGTATGVNGEDLNSQLDLSDTTKTDAGDYPSDHWGFSDDTGNYNDASGTVHDQIGKANATINVTPYSVTYDGDDHTASGTATGALGEDFSDQLELGGTMHTDAGDYPSDPWTFTDVTGNYNSASGTVHDHIAKADATIDVTPYSVTYDGNPHTATGTATGVKGEALSGLDLSGTTHTNAGDYATDPWTFTDVTGNYNDAGGAVHDHIAKVDATIHVTPYVLPYDGNPPTATGTATGVKGEGLSGLDLSGTTHTNAGDYATDPWTFTDVTGNYNNASGTVSDRIAAPTYTITAGAGANGSISPSGAVVVNYGANRTFTITPAASYYVATLTVDAVQTAPATSYTFTNVTAAHTIGATFAHVPYTIRASAGANGSISPSGAVVVNYGANQTFTITPALHYRVASVLVDGSSVGAVLSYTFTNVRAAHTISATFVKATP